MMNSDLTDFAIARLIEALGMFAHDLDVIINDRQDGMYTEDSYIQIAKQIKKGDSNV